MQEIACIVLFYLDLRGLGFLKITGIGEVSLVIFHSCICKNKLYQQASIGEDFCDKRDDICSDGI